MALPAAPPPLVTVQAHKARGELDSTQWAPGNGGQKNDGQALDLIRLIEASARPLTS